MPECLALRWNAGTTRRALGQESAPWSHFVALLTLIFAVSTALAQQLPPGGTTSWEIQGSEEIVTFVLFDPKAPGVSLPAGLRFVSARDARMPEIKEHLTQHPDHADWAFSFIEITRQKAFLLDGRAPVLPKNGGIGLWFAPVDSSQLAKEITKDWRRKAKASLLSEKPSSRPCNSNRSRRSCLAQKFKS